MKMEKLNLNREPSQEDKDFWAEFAGGVEKTEQPPEQPAKSVIIKEVEPTVRLNEVYRGNALGELREGQLADIDGAMARRFKRGDFAVEATLDLHRSRGQALFVIEMNSGWFDKHNVYPGHQIKELFNPNFCKKP